MNLLVTKNDKKARIIIFLFSAIVFVIVSILGKYKLNIDLPFDEHIFAKANALINTVVAVLLVAGIITAKNGQYHKHRNIMLTAMLLSVLFLVSYIAHHLLSGEAIYGDLNGDGVLNDAERLAAGSLRMIYIPLLITHIILAGLVLPFILFTAYRGLINENVKHRKLAKITWPMWFYVAVTGPIVYLLISPYYH